jgi:cytochrome c oxidase assembly protein subunit 15
VIALHRYACLLALATLGLIAAGGMVTSTHSGLSVPDWPTTYGYNMFTFPLGQMVGGIFYEHGHRLIASAVGMLTIGLAIWTTAVERRPWVRRLAWLALAAVILQGALGGLTVLYQLPDLISISHAGLAQVFFALTVTIAVVTSPGWRRPGSTPVSSPALARRMVALTVLIYLQIMLGATMRHTGAGLAIPDFPLAYGRLVPPFWNLGIGLHFTHRLVALLVTVFVWTNAVAIWRSLASRTEATRPALWLVLVVAVQITLGAYVVWSGKQPIINTLHVTTGALVLATSLVLTLRLHRTRIEGLGAVA